MIVELQENKNNDNYSLTCKHLQVRLKLPFFFNLAVASSNIIFRSISTWFQNNNIKIKLYWFKLEILFRNVSWISQTWKSHNFPKLSKYLNPFLLDYYIKSNCLIIFYQFKKLRDNLSFFKKKLFYLYY